jgi:aspartyl-tRNA synthetase
VPVSGRSLRALATAATARPCTGGGSLALPRRPARPASLRPLRASLAEAEQQAEAAAAGDAGEGMHSLAAAGVLEAGLTWPGRSHGCGALTEGDVGGGAVTVCGWVDRYRNLGGLLFLDIRDHTGVVQVIVDPQAQPQVAARAERVRQEWVVAVTGQLRRRSDPNPRLKTGTLEISPTDIKVGGGVCV